MYNQICRIRFFKSQTNSSFQINLLRFKPIKLNKEFYIMIFNMIMERLYEKELPKLTSTCFTKDLKNVFSKSNAK